tara:strand:+ start:680 stop:790 length:111 start_codon:yes stop_codon:yes gene_type:complete
MIWKDNGKLCHIFSIKGIKWGKKQLKQIHNSTFKAV